ncbi:hypothetical protein VBD025_14720 [Virgibacillus flavescens]|uniref:hypothetical protein n=1 Tax=Virgibacillus flavescens TaxID=1611422 RepID=UPI003D327BFF
MMPDWSYHPLKKLLLDKISPKTGREFIHNSMSTIASVPGGRSLIGFLGHMKPASFFQKEIHQTIFPSFIGLSGDIDPNLSGINAFQELGFGFLEIGPIVLHEPLEQREPKKNNKHILFSDQQEKVPLKLAIKKLTSLNVRIPVFARVDAQVNKNEWDIIVQQLTPFVDAFIVTDKQISSCDDQHVQCLERPLYISFSADEMKGLDTRKLQHTCIAGIAVTAPRIMKDGYWLEAANANECLATIRLKKLNDELLS